MPAVAQDLISRLMEYVPKETLISGSDSTYLGEIQKFESP
jgi:hypothetical protein